MPSESPGAAGTTRLLRGAALAAALGIAALHLVYLRSHAQSPIGVRLDSWSESNIVVSARNAARHGWGAYGGVAQHQVERPPFARDPLFLYAHYPLGTYYLTWAMYDWLGEDVAALRWLPALFSAAALVLWYFLVSRIAGAAAALLSAASLATAYGFLAYADDLHHAYPWALLAGMMLAYVTAIEERGRRRRLLLGVSWLLLFANSFLSWEWYLWSQAFYWGHALLLGTPLRKRWLLIFAAAALLAAGVQRQVRVHAFGADAGAGLVEDLRRRTIGLEETDDTPAGTTLRDVPSYVAVRFEQLYGSGVLPLWWLVAVVGLASGGIRPGDGSVAPPYRWLVLLFLCGASWWCVMLQHTVVHPHVMRHALLFYALFAGLALETALRFLLGRGRRWWVRLAGASLALAVVLPHLRLTRLDMQAHSDRQFRHPSGWTAAWNEVESMREYARLLPPDAVVLTNHNRPPLLRYWLDVPVYSATFERFPFRRGEPLPGARVRLELASSHLGSLYGGASARPRVVYLYVFRGDVQSQYLGDPVLWKLIDGVWSKPASYERLARFGEVLSGTASPAHAILARGRTWIAFEAGDLLDDLPPDVERGPPPDRGAFGPPR
jgi:hypothetical protein